MRFRHNIRRHVGVLSLRHQHLRIYDCSHQSHLIKAVSTHAQARARHPHEHMAVRIYPQGSQAHARYQMLVVACHECVPAFARVPPQDAVIMPVGETGASREIGTG